MACLMKAYIVASGPWFRNNAILFSELVACAVSLDKAVIARINVDEFVLLVVGGGSVGRV